MSTCPYCHQVASGKFCQNCGAPQSSLPDDPYHKYCKGCGSELIWTVSDRRAHDGYEGYEHGYPPFRGAERYAYAIGFRCPKENLRNLFSHESGYVDFNSGEAPFLARASQVITYAQLHNIPIRIDIPLPGSCSNCGQTVADIEKFCGGCGTKYERR